MMTHKRLPVLLALALLLLAGAGWWGYTAVQQRVARCAPVPLVAPNLLPNANLAQPGDTPTLPAGWQAGAPGVLLGSFALDGDERALHLMGIANYVQTPPVPVQPGQTYCFVGHAITDSALASATQVRVSFHWLDGQGTPLAEATTPWQPVVLWREESPPESWSRITAAFAAPDGAETLLVRLHPASDDRIYLDVMHVQQGGTPVRSPEPASVAGVTGVTGITVAPWPNGTRAALSFSFDWETAMAGLVHSRSVGDPYIDQDPVVRGLRMREGITGTLALFRPYGIRATYYAAGYTLLLSNTSKTTFMDNPTYAWASTANRWTSDHWTTTPWFANDPYGTAQSHPAWYAGDLVSLLLREGHDIQTHTFTHFYGGFVGADEWRKDMATWERAAMQRGAAPPRSLAFPWSSSGGMSYASWDTLEAAGITSVTRLSDQSQYNLFPYDERGIVTTPRCMPLPGHERVLACPDFYMTPDTAERAIEQINRARQVEGAIDLWAHTEEVVSDEQRAAWERVVSYAAAQPDVWIAPLREIADWQQALAQVDVDVDMGTQTQPTDAPLVLTVTNGSSRTLDGLTLRAAAPIDRATIDGQAVASDPARAANELVLTIRAGETREVRLWLA